jgi:hypothetical protein
VVEHGILSCVVALVIVYAAASGFSPRAILETVVFTGRWRLGREISQEAKLTG